MRARTGDHQLRIRDQRSQAEFPAVRRVASQAWPAVPEPAESGRSTGRSGRRFGGLMRPRLGDQAAASSNPRPIVPVLRDRSPGNESPVGQRSGHGRDEL